MVQKQRRTAAEKASTVKKARQAEAGGAAAESGDGVIIIGRACATATAVEDQAENYWYTFSMGKLCSCQIFSLVAVVFGLGEHPLPDLARACAASAHFLSQGTDVSTESDPRAARNCLISKDGLTCLYTTAVGCLCGRSHWVDDDRRRC